MLNTRYATGTNASANARGLTMAAAVLLVCMGYLLMMIASLNADIQQANAKADLERQCARALEAWVHRQVNPGDLPKAEALNAATLSAVKNKACRTKLVL